MSGTTEPVAPSRPFARRQTPGPGEIFLDHLGWFVRDVDEAGRAFERLGFRLTPYTVHENADSTGKKTRTGTANRCAMLPLGYLEILTDVAELDTPFANQLRAARARYTGIHLIAFTCADANAEAARLEEAGFNPQPVSNLRRPITTDTGERADTAFSVVRVPATMMPEGRIQILSQDTPDVTWQPSLIARDNGATALSGALVVSADPVEAAARFARFTGKPAGRTAIGHALVLDRGRVDFVAAETLSEVLPGAVAPALPFIAAVVIECADLAASLGFLSGQGAESLEIADGIAVIDPEHAAGAWLVLHGPDAVWPAPIVG